jgi:hypothetical protein
VSTLTRNIRVCIEPSTWLRPTQADLQWIGDEEYLSKDGSCLLQLQKDSEIRFGPAFYKAAVLGRDRQRILDFGERRFLSCSGYGLGRTTLCGPWSPVSLSLALPELLSTRLAPGNNLARMNIFDVSQQRQIAAWDFESLITHKMWSPDGKLYLFRDVYNIYTSSVGRLTLTSISTSRSPYCFVLEGGFACVIEESGQVSVLDGAAGDLLATEHISVDGYTLRRAMFDEKQNCILVLLKCQYGPDADELCLCVRLQQGN